MNGSAPPTALACVFGVILLCSHWLDTCNVIFHREHLSGSFFAPTQQRRLCCCVMGSPTPVLAYCHPHLPWAVLQYSACTLAQHSAPMPAHCSALGPSSASALLFGEVEGGVLDARWPCVGACLDRWPCRQCTCVQPHSPWNQLSPCAWPGCLPCSPATLLLFTSWPVGVRLRSTCVAPLCTTARSVWQPRLVCLFPVRHC